MKIKIGASSLLLTETEDNVQLTLAFEKLKGKAKAILLILAFSLTTVLATAGFLWLSLGIFMSLITILVADFLLNGLNYKMDFELEPNLTEDIMNDVLVEGR